jgi:hypothetical protein
MPVWFPLFFVGLWLLVSAILSVMSGWTDLAKRFRSSRRPEGRSLSWQVVSVGFVPENGVTALVVSPEGLYLSSFPIFRFMRPPLLVPWNEVRLVSSRSFFGRIERFTLELASATSLTIKRAAFDAMQPYVQRPGTTPN